MVPCSRYLPDDFSFSLKKVVFVGLVVLVSAILIWEKTQIASNLGIYAYLDQKNHIIQGVDSMTEENEYDFSSNIYRVCQRIEDGHYMIPKNNTNSRQRGIVDHYSKVVYCDIPKVATRSWLVFFNKLTAINKEERLVKYGNHTYSFNRLRVGDDRWEYLLPYGINRLSRKQDETQYGLPDPRKEYFKFMVARHPLERLASAYRNKLAGSNRRRNTVYKLQRKMLNYIKAEDMNEIRDLSFQEFLEYVKITDQQMTQDIEQHFHTCQSICCPCSINYDYVAHLESLGEGLKHILPVLHGEEFLDTFPERKLKADPSKSKYLAMYKDIPYNVLKPVLDKYKADADMFGYTFDEYINQSETSP